MKDHHVEEITLDPSTNGFFSSVEEVAVIRTLDSRDWLTKASILLMLSSSLLTYLIIILQGFHLWGFVLPDQFLNWLGGATIGSLIANITILYTHHYKSKIPAAKENKNG